MYFLFSNQEKYATIFLAQNSGFRIGLIFCFNSLREVERMEKTNNILKKYTSIVLAFILTVVCMACFNVETSVDSTNAASEELSSIENEMALKINEARLELGLKPLYIVPYLNDVARTRSRELLENYDHIRPDGNSWVSIIDRTLVPWNSADEILARGSSNVDLVFKAWKNSEVHWNAITSDKVTHFGIGLSYEPNSDRKWYWSVIFVVLDDEVVLNGQEVPVKYRVIPQSTGDLNGDGQVDSFDLVLLKKYVADKDSVYFNDLQIAAADTFKDGAVTSADVLMLSKYILGEYSKLPVTIDMLL